MLICSLRIVSKSVSKSRFIYAGYPGSLDDNGPASARVSAARTVLESALKGVELEDLAVRVEELEFQVSSV